MSDKIKGRDFLIVLDSFGCGAAVDADKFGDAGIDGCPGANTLATVAKSKYFDAPNLLSMGLFAAAGLECPIPPDEKINSFAVSYGRLRERSAGKDTVIGHWELCGVVSERPMPTYPNGFPRSVVLALQEATELKYLCNLPYSGTKVIADYGEQHLLSGRPILYTSADSVMQIAAHESVIPLQQLYGICEKARAIMTGEHAVGRIIARPFVGMPGSFSRTPNRRDFALTPPAPTLLDRVKDSGRSVIAVGKINDIFAARGITETVRTHSNAEGIAKIIEYAKADFDGLCFVNLVDFDMLYGHRNDADGYAAAVSEFDRALPELFSLLREGDRVIITADHGCDPGYPTTDHTREYVPYLALGCEAPGSIGTADFRHVCDVLASR